MSPEQVLVIVTVLAFAVLAAAAQVVRALDGDQQREEEDR